MADGVDLLRAVKGFFDPINRAIEMHIELQQRNLDRKDRQALEERIQQRLDDQLAAQKKYYDDQLKQGEREFTEGQRQFNVGEARQRSQNFINMAFKFADTLRDFSVAGAQVRAAGEQAATSRSERERAEREAPTRQRLLEAQVTGAEAEADISTRRNEAEIAKLYAEVDAMAGEGREREMRTKLLRIEQLKGMQALSPEAAAASIKSQGAKGREAAALLGRITPQERRELTDIIADMHADINETYATPGITPEQIKEAIQRRVRQAMTLIPTVVGDPSAQEDALRQMQGAAASAYGDAVPELRSAPQGSAGAPTGTVSPAGPPGASTPVPPSGTAGPQTRAFGEAPPLDVQPQKTPSRKNMFGTQNLGAQYRRALSPIVEPIGSFLQKHVTLPSDPRYRRPGETREQAYDRRNRESVDRLLGRRRQPIRQMGPQAQFGAPGFNLHSFNEAAPIQPPGQRTPEQELELLLEILNR